MSLNKTISMILCVAIMASAGCLGNGLNWNDYDATHQYASIAIPWAKELEEQFTSCDHFITHYGSSDNKNIWNTVTFFGERYELHAQCDIKVNYRKNTFEAISVPVFRLFEISSVESNGTAHHGESFTFSLVDYNKLAENDFDFSTIGIAINTASVPNFEVYEKNTRRQMRHVSLVRVK